MAFGLRPYGTQPYALLDTPAAGGTVTATLNATLSPPTFSGAATVAVAATLAATTPEPTFTGAATVAVSATLAATTPEPTFTGAATVAVSATLAATTQEPTFTGSATVAVTGTLDATTDAPTFTGSVDSGAPVSASVGGGRRRTSNNAPLGNRSHTTPRRNSRRGEAEEEMAETLAALRPGAQIRVMPNDDETDDEEAILWLIH